MSRIKAGIFGQVTGKTGGIVFSKARGRDGVINTTRILTSPSNPRTANQTLQRGKFAESVRLLQAIGSDYYASNFNRAVGQLPGYQSWMNRSLTFRDVNNQFIEGPTIRFSSRPGITGINVAADTPTELLITWDSVTPAGADPNDVVDVVIYPADPSLANQNTVQTLETTRTSGEVIFVVPNANIPYLAVLTTYTPGRLLRLEIQDKKKDA